MLDSLRYQHCRFGPAQMGNSSCNNASCCREDTAAICWGNGDRNRTIWHCRPDSKSVCCCHCNVSPTSGQEERKHSIDVGLIGLENSNRDEGPRSKYGTSNDLENHSNGEESCCESDELPACEAEPSRVINSDVHESSNGLASLELVSNRSINTMEPPLLPPVSPRSKDTNGLGRSLTSLRCNVVRLLTEQQQIIDDFTKFCELQEVGQYKCGPSGKAVKISLAKLDQNSADSIQPCHVLIVPASQRKALSCMSLVSPKRDFHRQRGPSAFCSNSSRNF